MKKIPLFLLLTLLYCTISYAQVERIERGNLVIEGIPEIPTEVADRLQQYQNVRSASLSDWLNDSSGVLISTRFGETSQIHKVIMPGGTRQQYNGPQK